MMRTPRSLLARLALTTFCPMASTSPALAGDGRIEINQTAALVGGITPGDAPGFPITLDQPGSYVLTGPLVVPANQSGIMVAASSVSIDLNGFGMSGPVSCTGSRTAVDCSAPAPSYGIGNVDVSTNRRTRVHDGFVNGFATCLDMGRRSRVDGVNVEECGMIGIAAGPVRER